MCVCVGGGGGGGGGACEVCVRGDSREVLTCLVCPSQEVVRLVPAGGEETPLDGKEMMVVPVCQYHLQLGHSGVVGEGTVRREGC